MPADPSRQTTAFVLGLSRGRLDFDLPTPTLIRAVARTQYAAQTIPLRGGAQIIPPGPRRVVLHGDGTCSHVEAKPR